MMKRGRLMKKGDSVYKIDPFGVLKSASMSVTVKAAEKAYIKQLQQVLEEVSP